MKKQSAGLLVYRKQGNNVEVLIAHMGSPWWAKKDLGAWSIPKGEYTEGEDAMKTAKREFEEELGKKSPGGKWQELGTVEQSNNKTVIAWAVEGDLDATSIKSNTFEIEWPPRSSRMQEFPEIDKADWFNLEEAAKKLVPAQVLFLERLAKQLRIPLELPPQSSSQSSLF